MANRLVRADHLGRAWTPMSIEFQSARRKPCVMLGEGQSLGQQVRDSL